MKETETVKCAKPIKATWFVWASLDTAALVSMYLDSLKHPENESSINGQITAAVIGAWTVFFLSLKFGDPGWDWLDVLCFVALAISILLIIFGDAFLGLVASLGGNIVGSWPTVRSAWRDCRRESKLSWGMATAASFCAMASVANPNISNLIQSLGFLVIQVPMLYLLFVRAAKPVTITVT